MPYELRGNCVYNKDTGEKKGCSDTRAEAVKHMRALYAAERGTKSLDDDYAEMSLDNPDVCFCASCTSEEDDILVKMVWTTKYINSLPDSSFAYVEPGCDTGSCRHFPIKDAEGNYDAAHVRNALARLSQSPFGDKARSKVESGAKVLKIGQKEADTTLANAVRELTSHIKGLINPPVSAKPTITFKAQSDGRTRVMMRVSNNFKDRHGEIITEEAHKAFAEHVSNNPDEMPEFWVWHIPGSRWGKADVVDYSDGFLTASGLVDVGMESVAKSVARDDWGVSHGFRGVSLTGKGFIDAYKSFEFSPLPRIPAAANIITGLMIAKEAGMDPTKRQKLLEVGIGEEILNQWDKDSKSVSEMLKSLGIEFKETEPTPDPPTPEPEPSPDEPKLSDVLNAIQAINSRLEGVEKSYKELEKKSEDYVASVLEPAIRPGGSVGFVASKSNDNKPTDAITKSNEEWEHELAEFLTGKAVS